MTVESTTNRVQYTASGASATFAYPFYIIASTDLEVYKDGVLISSGNYTVTGVGVSTGGNVVFNVIPVAGVVVTIVRSVPFTQKINLINNAEEPSENIEQALDRAVMLCQQISEEIDRTIKLPITTTLSAIEFPDGPANLGKYIKWNAAGTALEAVAVVSPGSVVFSSYGEGLVAIASAALARAYLGTTDTTSADVYGASATGNDNYAITISSAIVSYTTGLVVRFKADVQNTGACSINVNALGAKAIKKYASTDPATGDIVANQIVTLVYDGTNFQLCGSENSYLRTEVSTSLLNNIAINGIDSGSVARNLVNIGPSNVVSIGSNLGTTTLVLHSTGTEPLFTSPTLSNQKIWHQGNDGAGSTLDADTLDTYEAAAFLRKAETGDIDLSANSISIPNAKYLYGKNNAAVNVPIARVNSSNVIEIGSASAALNILTTGGGLQHNGVNVIIETSPYILRARARVGSAGGAPVESYNVSSVTHNGTGDYTCVFTTNLGTDDYTPVVMTQTAAGPNVVISNIDESTAPTVSSFRYSITSEAGAGFDVDHWLVVFGVA